MITWTDKAWEQYLEWQRENKKIVKRINTLIFDIDRNGILKGIGKPEALKGSKACSRRIDDEHRLVYSMEDGNIVIYACRGHYEE
ncbi:MAG: Txe/YoeB family addiction module toxin [Firmicutes bacterium]|nr:Txe/YoeB family addiction module toxin [Bacillota bacterium]